ncbi:MAG TPA: hypothetical protein VMU48_09225 [Terracidiphilus sp.]|nr:hypothetical protein [Terracidiphilus sp.]
MPDGDKEGSQEEFFFLKIEIAQVLIEQEVCEKIVFKEIIVAEVFSFGRKER